MSSTMTRSRSPISCVAPLSAAEMTSLAVSGVSGSLGSPRPRLQGASSMPPWRPSLSIHLMNALTLVIDCLATLGA